MISTRGRYALRILLDLAQRNPEQWTSLEEIASSQQISKKYLESIVRLLVQDGFLQALRGKHGGYRLTRKPQEYSLQAILETAEGGLEPVACLKPSAAACPRQDFCQTLPLWENFSELITGYFASLSLQDVLDGNYPEIPDFRRSAQKQTEGKT